MRTIYRGAAAALSGALCRRIFGIPQFLCYQAYYPYKLLGHEFFFFVTSFVLEQSQVPVLLTQHVAAQDRNAFPSIFLGCIYIVSERRECYVNVIVSTGLATFILILTFPANWVCHRKSNWGLSRAIKEELHMPPQQLSQQEYPNKNVDLKYMNVRIPAWVSRKSAKPKIKRYFSPDRDKNFLT